MSSCRSVQEADQVWTGHTRRESEKDWSTGWCQGHLGPGRQVCWLHPTHHHALGVKAAWRNCHQRPSSHSVADHCRCCSAGPEPGALHKWAYLQLFAKLGLLICCSWKKIFPSIPGWFWPCWLVSWTKHMPIVFLLLVLVGTIHIHQACISILWTMGIYSNVGHFCFHRWL